MPSTDTIAYDLANVAGLRNTYQKNGPIDTGQ